MTPDPEFTCHYCHDEFIALFVVDDIQACSECYEKFVFSTLEPEVKKNGQKKH